jgi:hypothetical protein
MENKLTLEEMREACINSYAFFAALMQDDGWFEPSHKLLCDWLQYWFEKDTSANKTFQAMVILPRASLKSTIVTKYFPVWVTLHYFYKFGDDSVRSLIATNTMPNAHKKMSDIRGLFDSHEIFRALFSELLPNKNCRWTSEGLTLPRSRDYPESTFEGAGVRTKLTGRHYNGIIEDDTTAPDADEMTADVTLPSMETIERAVGWHKAATPLLMPRGLSFSVIVTTRWADEDLVTYLAKHEDYRKFDLPAVQKTEEGSVYTFPSLYPAEKLSDIKRKVGPYMFSCLYLNNPVDVKKRIFQSQWFSYIAKARVPERGFCSVAIDPAISEKDEACETAITCVQHVPMVNGEPFEEGQKVVNGDILENHQYWWRAEHSHMLPSAQVGRTLDIAEYAQAHIAPVKGIVVETVAYQAVLCYLLADEMKKRGIYFNIIPYGTRTKKDLRIQGLQPLFFQKIIHFVEDQLSDQVESQLKQYPHGKLVDVIDCFTLHKPMYKYSGRLGSPAVHVPKEESIMDFVERNRRKGSSINRFTTSFDSIETSMETGLAEINIYTTPNRSLTYV